MRKLRRINKAASEVGKVIGEITDRTEKGLEDQKGSAGQIGLLVSRAQETKGVIDNVIAKVSSIVDNVQSIAAAMEEQAASPRNGGGNGPRDPFQRGYQRTGRSINCSMEEQDK